MIGRGGALNGGGMGFCFCMISKYKFQLSNEHNHYLQRHRNFQEKSTFVFVHSSPQVKAPSDSQNPFSTAQMSPSP